MKNNKQLQEEKIKAAGKYISRLTSAELTKWQRYKSLFMYLSTLFFAVSLFLSVEGRVKVMGILWLATLYTMFDILLIVVSVYVSFQGFKKHKITSEISELNAPKRGFNKFTYFSFELFNLLHIALFIIEVIISCLTFEVWGIINIIVVIISAVFAFISRMILFRANAHNLDYLPPVKPQKVDEVAADETAEPLKKAEVIDKNSIIKENIEKNKVNALKSAKQFKQSNSKPENIQVKKEDKNHTEDDNDFYEQ